MTERSPAPFWMSRCFSSATRAARLLRSKIVAATEARHCTSVARKATAYGHGLRFDQTGRLVTLSLNDELPHWDVSLITRRDPPLTPVARALATMLRRAAPRSAPL